MCKKNSFSYADYCCFQTTFGPIETSTMPLAHELNENSDGLDHWIYALSQIHLTHPEYREKARYLLKKLTKLEPITISDYEMITNFIKTVERTEPTEAA